jgi:hypothetical protein
MLGCSTCDLVLPASRAGTPCPRCRATLHLRKPDALVRTAALLAAASVRGRRLPGSVRVQRLSQVEQHGLPSIRAAHDAAGRLALARPRISHSRLLARAMNPIVTSPIGTITA